MTKEERKKNVELLLNDCFNWGYTRGYICCSEKHQLPFYKEEDSDKFKFQDFIDYEDTKHLIRAIFEVNLFDEIPTKLIKENGLYGVIDGDTKIVPCSYKTKEGAIHEFQYFGRMNTRKQFMPHQRTEEEIYRIVNDLKHQDIT